MSSFPGSLPARRSLPIAIATVFICRTSCFLWLHPNILLHLVYTMFIYITFDNHTLFPFISIPWQFILMLSIVDCASPPMEYPSLQ